MRVLQIQSGTPLTSVALLTLDMVYPTSGMPLTCEPLMCEHVRQAADVRTRAASRWVIENTLRQNLSERQAADMRTRAASRLDIESGCDKLKCVHERQAADVRPRAASR